ncbi:MAG: class I SAM-dependent DNA methyltransferase [Bacteroidales bacterium]|nr:class I SAM-dependent DNA methyltransferase [Bacteroidales bacterium]
MDDKEIRKNLNIQTKFWSNQEGYEKGKGQQFWNSILRCFDPQVDLPNTIIFEKQVKDPETGITHFIDAYIPRTRVLIEQKSSNIALDKPEQQSEGAMLTPFQQAERYDNWLPLNEKARYIVCSNFRIIEIHDRNKPLEPPFIIPFTEEGITQNYYRLKFLLDKESSVTALETAVSKAAALQIGSLYNDIIKQYSKDDLTPELYKNINEFCVRLVFCLYAEDSLVFCRKDMFGNYLKNYIHNSDDFRLHLKHLFQTLNTPLSERDSEEVKLNEFPYTNGGLFASKTILPKFSENIAFKITQKFSLEFDWSPINPAIFGAMFESTLSSQDRREGGMHYTTTDNIDKALAPLFLNTFRQRLEEAIRIPDLKAKRDTLLALQDDLASVKILDPACGSGNFLTYTFMELRRLENKILYELHTAGLLADANVETRLIASLPSSPIRVSLSQFYGFEINDFAVDTAKTALWIAQNQMLHETQQILGENIPELPLCNIDTIHCVNALRINWEDYVKPEDLDYIVGNPPFVGARIMNNEQKEDVINIFGKDWKNVGNMDYVTCWYKKAFDFIKQNPKIHCAFVSTNSICQGEQVANLWKPLFEDGLVINYAYRTFRWESDSVGMAHVHCVILGFSTANVETPYYDVSTPRRIYNPDGTIENAKNINAYLLDGPNVFVESRNKPICNVPEIGMGNQPIDNGNYLFTEEQMNDFINIEPKSKKYFRQWLGAEEFINNKKRYCLWLGDADPLELSKMPKCLERIKAVKNFRLSSKRTSTIKLAEKPTRFQTENMPDSDYLLVPSVSSEKRKYIPIGFMHKDIIASNLVQIIPNATLYEFGILTSIVHNAWMRVVAGRLESRYRYSKDIVYNNFPWPVVDGGGCRDGVHTVSTCAQKILDVRDHYLKQGASLADLYGENLELLFTDLAAAHNELDKVVLGLYGLKADASEAEMVGRLFEMIG